jgi:hypothetical protein
VSVVTATATAAARRVAERVTSLSALRFVLWASLVAKLITGWGVQWDIQWHVTIGRDTFWIPPHVMTYAGVALSVMLSFGLLAWTTFRAPRTLPPDLVSIAGVVGTRGTQIAAWGIALTVLAAPIDDLWHRLFGIDVTLWSPPHLLGILGAAVNTVGCLVMAREAYPAASRARLVALLVGGALLYSGLHFVMQPTFRLAYMAGGVSFHSYAILAPLLLPLALVAASRLSDRRWAPLLVMALVVVTGLIGRGIAHTGFEMTKPVSVIDDEIAKDATSPIAVGQIIMRMNAARPDPLGPLAPFLVPLVPALAIVLVDARRRPVWATLAYAASVFVVMGVRLAGLPAFSARVPTLGATAIAAVVTLGSAVVSGLVVRRISDGVAAAAR